MSVHESIEVGTKSALKRCILIGSPGQPKLLCLIPIIGYCEFDPADLFVWTHKKTPVVVEWDIEGRGRFMCDVERCGWRLISSGELLLPVLRFTTSAKLDESPIISGAVMVTVIKTRMIMKRVMFCREVPE
ncbi:hypothetical protein F2P81_004276 [Scophthalmus maximus]|uniref:Uncharacterized protein n=1 Tax=Scophthalmus maximus TaxID=52904 RepID=A0A6A4TDF7_SCOMX|nr:hypothetical protein F2P81_004276 [Scophthalmus maximus]